jgi:hypothetical protein
MTIRTSATVTLTGSWTNLGAGPIFGNTNGHNKGFLELGYSDGSTAPTVGIPVGDDFAVVSSRTENTWLRTTTGASIEFRYYAYENTQ